MPQLILPFEAISKDLKGELKIQINHEQVKKGMLAEIEKWMLQAKGNFKLVTQVHLEDLYSYLLESRKTFFPSEGLLTWLESEKVDFQLRVSSNA